VGLLLGVVVLLARHRDTEPLYREERLGTWVMQYNESRITGNRPDSIEAALAIKAIGSNGLPYLLQSLQHETSPGNRRFSYVLRHLPLNLSSKKFVQSMAATADSGTAHAEAAMWAFLPLQSQAEPAIPELARLMRSTNTGSSRAVIALACLGKRAVPTLVNGLTNPSPAHRMRIAAILGDREFFPEIVSTNVAALLKCLEDPDAGVAWAGAASLGNLQAQPETVLPALQLAAEKHGVHEVRLEAIKAIGRFGAEGRAAMPFLIRALSSTNSEQAEAATNALRQVAPDLLTKATSQ